MARHPCPLLTVSQTIRRSKAKERIKEGKTVVKDEAFVPSLQGERGSAPPVQPNEMATSPEYLLGKRTS
jgi:hypothetical protein